MAYVIGVYIFFATSIKYWKLYVDGPICPPANNMCTAVD